MKLFTLPAFERTLLQNFVCAYELLTTTNQEQMAQQQKIFICILRILGMIFKVEYLGKMDFMFTTNLEYESGDQVGSLMKKPEVKNLMQV
jgi:hypothetical protein